MKLARPVAVHCLLSALLLACPSTAAASEAERGCDAGTCLQRAKDLPDASGAPDVAPRSEAELDKACTAGGDLDSCWRLGLALQSQKGTTQAPRVVALFRQACDGGVFFGCALLGAKYSAGWGVAVDGVRAAQLAKQACGGGEPHGCLLYGDLIPAERALEFYLKACDGSVMVGCTRAADLLSGRMAGGMADVPRAAALYDRACQGSSGGTGCYELARLHDEGLVREDCGIKRKLWETACLHSGSCDCALMTEDGRPDAALRHAELQLSSRLVEWDGSQVKARQTAEDCLLSACNGGLAEACARGARQEGFWKSPFQDQGCALGDESLCKKGSPKPQARRIQPNPTCPQPEPDDPAVHARVPAEELDLMRAVCGEEPIVRDSLLSPKQPVLSCRRDPPYLSKQKEGEWSPNWIVKGSFLVAGRAEALVQMGRGWAPRRHVLLAREDGRWRSVQAFGEADGFETPQVLRSAGNTDHLVSGTLSGQTWLLGVYRVREWGIASLRLATLIQNLPSRFEVSGAVTVSWEEEGVTQQLRFTRAGERYLASKGAEESPISAWERFAAEVDVSARWQRWRRPVTPPCLWEDCDPPAAPRKVLNPMSPPTEGKVTAFLAQGKSQRPLTWGDESSGRFQVEAGRITWEAGPQRCDKPVPYSVSRDVVAFTCTVAGTSKRFLLELRAVSAEALLYRLGASTHLVHGCEQSPTSLTCRTRLDPLTVRIIPAANDKRRLDDLLGKAKEIPDTQNTPVFFLGQAAVRRRRASEIYFGNRDGQRLGEMLSRAFPGLLGKARPEAWFGGGLWEDVAIVVGTEPAAAE